MNFERVLAVRTSKTIYKDGELAIKLFHQGYSKADILNEALNQARVEETGIAIPKLIEVTKYQDKWAIVMEFVKGKTLASLMEENPEKLPLYMERFVELQTKVHGHSAPLLNKLKDKMSRKISEADLPSTTRYELHTRLESMPTHKKVCHGDFNPSNIIIGDDGIDYIIDWSHATQGNASADAARTYLLFSLAGQKSTADMYLDLFCAKSNIDKSYVQKWLPIVAASQSVKGKKEEREFLLRWADVVDYE